MRIMTSGRHRGSVFHSASTPDLASSVRRRSGGDAAAVPTILLLGHPPSVAADCRDMCAAEGWRLIECGSLGELAVACESDRPWILVLPEMLEGVRIAELCVLIRALPLPLDIPLVGFLILGSKATQIEVAQAGIDVCVSYGQGIEGLRSELNRLIVIVAELRVRADRLAHRSATYAGPRRRRSDR